MLKTLTLIILTSLAIATPSFAQPPTSESGVTLRDLFTAEHRPIPRPKFVQPPPPPIFFTERFQKAVRRQARQLVRCYDNALKTHFIEGRVTLEWTVGRDGRVKQARIARSTLENAESMESCLVMRVRRWRFKPPGAEATVQFVFVFVPG